jgi:hypothetical protein
MRKIAFATIKRARGPVIMVCGPITTGGLGSIKKNVTAFKNAIRRVSSSGKNVFSQMPFEPHMWRIMKTPYYKGRLHLLKTFYLPIFESGMLVELHFMRRSKTSYGARWEHAQALRLGIRIIYL